MNLNYNNNFKNQNETTQNKNQNSINNEILNKNSYFIDNTNNLNDNKISINKSNLQQLNNSSSNHNKLFIIKETNKNIYIENVKQFCTIKISKAFKKKKICIIDDKNELMNINPINILQVDSIIGIFDLNDNKYLGVVTSSTEKAKLMDSYIYIINSIELIKITYKKESSNDVNIIEDIKKMFLSKNIYYSNDYDISSSLYSQSKTYNNGDNSNIINSKYLINSFLLKYFLDSHIPDFFFCSIIMGYVGYQNDIYLDKNNNIDIFIIERYFIKTVVLCNNIPEYIKQIEFIFVFKNKCNSYSDEIFSYTFFISSYTLEIINKFLPYRIIDELYLYKNVICILNDKVKNMYDKKRINDEIIKFNKKYLNNKINIINFISDWDKNFLFDNIYDSIKLIDFYYNESKENVQENIFWYIDLNNNNFNQFTYATFIGKIVWKVLQKIINFNKLNINIGSFDCNNNINKNFHELIIKYKTDLIENKYPLLTENNIKSQEIINSYLGYKNNIINNNLNKDNKNNKDIGTKTLNILCITWNVGGIPIKQYNISDLFTKHKCYKENNSPDIIVISMQEIVALNISNILIASNQDYVNFWKNLIKSTVKEVYPKGNYIELISLNLVGIFNLILIKKELKKNINVIDYSITKRGMFGTLGNKGFFIVSLKYFDSIISFGSGHFEAGIEKNEERIDSLIQLLNKPINIEEKKTITFKDSDYWIILGDLNFRIDLGYKEILIFIQMMKYEALYNFEQFNSAFSNIKFLRQYIQENKINFAPTYKFEKGINKYSYDEDKIRTPAWTDRIFFCKNKGINMLTYECIKSLKYSDHRPVVGAFEIDICFNKNNNNYDLSYYDKNIINNINLNNKKDINNNDKSNNNSQNNSNYKSFNNNENQNLPIKKNY